MLFSSERAECSNNQPASADDRWCATELEKAEPGSKRQDSMAVTIHRGLCGWGMKLTATRARGGCGAAKPGQEKRKKRARGNAKRCRQRVVDRAMEVARRPYRPTSIRL